MRLSLVTLWLRAASGDPPRRGCAQRYALGVPFLQVAWVALLFAPREYGLLGFWILATGEILVPAWAERAAPTTWHPEHIAERYGLFTLITLGESILAALVAIRSATEAGASAVGLLPIIVGGLLIVFSFWWLYFERAAHELLESATSAFLWGYGHYFVFGSAAAVGAEAPRRHGAHHGYRLTRDARVGPTIRVVSLVVIEPGHEVAPRRATPAASGRRAN
jgi:low temperature requirement protein LtrA